MWGGREMGAGICFSLYTYLYQVCDLSVVFRIFIYVCVCIYICIHYILYIL